MKVNRKDLQNALSLALRVMDKKHSTIPVLNNVLIDFTDGPKLIATNLDQSIEVALGGEGRGKMCVPGSLLNGIVNRLSDEVLAFTENDNNFILKSEAGDIKLTKTNPEHFPSTPAIPSIGTLEFSAIDLKAAFQANLCGTSEDRNQWSSVANAVFFTGDNGTFHCVSTDGHRMAKVDGEFTGDSFDFVLPLYAVRVLASSLQEKQGKVSVAEDSNHFFFILEGIQYAFRKTTINAPNWRFVIEKHPMTMFGKGPADEITQGLEIVREVMDQRSRKVNTDYNGNLKMSAQSESGEVSRIVAIESDMDAKAAFNIDYILPVFRYFEGEVGLGLHEKEVTPPDGPPYKQYYMRVQQGNTSFLVGSVKR